MGSSYSTNLTDDVANSIVTSKGNCRVVGSYVYKRLMRGEVVKDVDCVCDDLQTTVRELKELFDATEVSNSDVYNAEINELSRNGEVDRDDYVQLKVDNINVDILSESAYQSLAKDYNSFVHNVVHTENGLEHKHGGNDEQVKFIADSLKNNEYCVWLNMRHKDNSYFNRMSTIDLDVCDRYGL